MTRALALKQKQVTAICKGAAKAGHIAVVRIGDVVVQLVPEDHDILKGAAKDKIDEDEDFRL
jgi:hypothetical protein